jgi:hypothetical protein
VIRRHLLIRALLGAEKRASNHPFDERAVCTLARCYPGLDAPDPLFRGPALPARFNETAWRSRLFKAARHRAFGSSLSAKIGSRPLPEVLSIHETPYGAAPVFHSLSPDCGRVAGSLISERIAAPPGRDASFTLGPPVTLM